MSNAYVLMTAMPPTKGHLALIEFAHLMTDPGDFVHVIVCTQPSEPFTRERVYALQDAAKAWHNVIVHAYHKEISQDATKPEFWDMWRDIMVFFGMTSDDKVVSSEAYGQKVADLFGAKFIPYDPARELNNIKATAVRKQPELLFDRMIPEFQTYLRKTITLFGAESVGKTTTSQIVADEINGRWIFEYARPYLEMVGAEVTDEKMFDIFNGQTAIQKQARDGVDKPFIIQDTDLFSTIGYWEFWKGEAAPTEWYRQAHALKSDLYIILAQNIPFEVDPLRYGGDKRESTDQFWIDLCEREGLRYLVVEVTGLAERCDFVWTVCHNEFNETARPLMKYERKHNA